MNGDVFCGTQQYDEGGVRDVLTCPTNSSKEDDAAAAAQCSRIGLSSMITKNQGRITTIIFKGDQQTHRLSSSVIVISEVSALHP